MIHASLATLTADPNAPENHPMWEEQVRLEKGMLREAQKAFRERVVDATKKQQMTRLSPIRGLHTTWLPKVAEQLSAWIALYSKRTGPVPVALQFLRDMDRYVAAAIALNEVLDGLTIEKTAATALAIRIGAAIEHEQQVILWEKQSPETFKTTQKHLDRTDATHHHRALVNIQAFNQLLRDGKFGFGWAKWDQDAKLRVGTELLNCIIRATGWFVLGSDPAHQHRKGVISSPKLMLLPKPELIEWFGKELDEEEVRRPAFMPTVVPPLKWVGTRRGGYHTPYVNTPRLIAFKASQMAQQEWAADEYDALDMPEEYEALHFLQDTGWRVNKRVLEIAKYGLVRHMGLGGLPLLDPEAYKPMPQPVGPSTEEVGKAHRKAMASWFNRKFHEASQRKAAIRTVRIASAYAGYDTMHFPHKMDFRGRKYPIPDALQPQGNDLARGLLEFAEGKPVTDESAGWIAVQLASSAGIDKVSFDDRIAWVEERNETWLKVAADPIGERHVWASEEMVQKGKPYALLAAIFDWVDYLEHGVGHISHLVVSVDGTCNGIQHLSALTLDEVAGAHVNLVPGDKPRDIYKFVADRLQDAVLRIEVAGGLPAEHAAFWLELLGRDPQSWSRSSTKRQVMVLPYGGSREAFYEYTTQWLDENHPVLDPKPTDSEFWKLRAQRVSWLSKLMWDVVSEVVSGGVTVMQWLQKCARVATKGDQPIFWVTPTGFVVRHFYGKQKKRDITVKLDGRRTVLKLAEVTKDLDKQAQLQGIPPNFVHSLDASALTRCILLAKSAGITAMTSVHDAYGTHAADMWTLHRCIREAFVMTHSVDMLARFRNACAAVIVGELMKGGTTDMLDAVAEAEALLPPLPAKGSLDLQGVLESDYFFA